MPEQKNRLIQTIDSLLDSKPFVIIAIDGRCGAGKTTLANELADIYSANLIHMDDFFLQPHQRTEARLSTPGQNVDHERFSQEVLAYINKNETFTYRIFDCKTKTFINDRILLPNRLWIIEGSYSTHPLFSSYYDLSIFCDIDPTIQKQRICARNLASWPAFESKWIPLEEAYFSAFDIRSSCDIIY